MRFLCICLHILCQVLFHYCCFGLHYIFFLFYLFFPTIFFICIRLCFFAHNLLPLHGKVVYFLVMTSLAFVILGFAFCASVFSCFCWVLFAPLALMLFIWLMLFSWSIPFGGDDILFSIEEGRSGREKLEIMIGRDKRGRSYEVGLKLPRHFHRPATFSDDRGINPQ